MWRGPVRFVLGLRVGFRFVQPRQFPFQHLDNRPLLCNDVTELADGSFLMGDRHFQFGDA